MAELRLTFHEELDGIRDDMIRLAAHVSEAVQKSTEALVGNDLELAQSVIHGDDVLDLISLEIEERCFNLIALQQPMASDMRSIVTAMKLSGEYERSGDLAVNICKALRRSYALHLTPTLRGLVESMNEEAVRLNRLSIDAYAEGNAGLAAALNDIDDRLDSLQTEFIQEIFKAHNDGHLTLKQTVQLALVARYYERVGDHAVNIGERVQYMVTGVSPESVGASRARAVLDAEAASAGEDDGSAPPIEASEAVEAD